ncbi:MAG: hypothetical protein J6R09_05305 [Alistipes sp.]|nr:hypothetical protein [Alistipes sp.]
MRLPLSSPWTALPLNVIKGASPNAIKCHKKRKKQQVISRLPAASGSKPDKQQIAQHH